MLFYAFGNAFFLSKCIFFSENLKKILRFTSKFRESRVTLNTGILLFYLMWMTLLHLQMPPNGVFHLGLNWLPKYPFTGMQNEKG